MAVALGPGHPEARLVLHATSATAPHDASGGHKMVEAAGVEPASLANKPAATTCLVRREFLLRDNDLTANARSLVRMVKFSAGNARSPLPT